MVVQLCICRHTWCVMQQSVDLTLVSIFSISEDIFRKGGKNLYLGENHLVMISYSQHY